MSRRRKTKPRSWRGLLVQILLDIPLLVGTSREAGERRAGYLRSLFTLGGGSRAVNSFAGNERERRKDVGDAGADGMAVLSCRDWDNRPCHAGGLIKAFDGQSSWSITTA